MARAMPFSPKSKMLYLFFKRLEVDDLKMGLKLFPRECARSLLDLKSFVAWDDKNRSWNMEVVFKADGERLNYSTWQAFVLDHELLPGDTIMFLFDHKNDKLHVKSKTWDSKVISVKKVIRPHLEAKEFFMPYHYLLPFYATNNVVMVEDDTGHITNLLLPTEDDGAASLSVPSWKTFKGSLGIKERDVVEIHCFRSQKYASSKSIHGQNRLKRSNKLSMR